MGHLNFFCWKLKPHIFQINNRNGLDQDPDPNTLLSLQGARTFRTMVEHDLYGGGGLGIHHPFLRNQTLVVIIIIVLTFIEVG